MRTKNEEPACSSNTTLARKRAETRPEDVIPILRNTALRALLSELRPLCKTIGKETDFEALTRGLRQQYKNRP